MKASNTIKVSCKEPKRTPTGRLAKRQYDLVGSAKFFESIPESVRCGFERNIDNGKDEKVIYHAKVATVRLNALPGKHRLVQSYDLTHKTIKLLLTNQLHWNSIKILSTYSCRWVIEEFFRNAKQLSDMEGATIRSEQGVTLSLILPGVLD